MKNTCRKADPNSCQQLIRAQQPFNSSCQATLVQLRGGPAGYLGEARNAGGMKSMAAVDHRERETGYRIQDTGYRIRDRGRQHRLKAIEHIKRVFALMAGKRIEGCLFRADKGRSSSRRSSRRSSRSKKNKERFCFPFALFVNFVLNSSRVLPCFWHKIELIHLMGINYVLSMLCMSAFRPSTTLDIFPSSTRARSRRWAEWPRMVSLVLSYPEQTRGSPRNHWHPAPSEAPQSSASFRGAQPHL